MHRKSKHKETSDPDKSSEYPVVKCGYLDNTKQSKNTEIHDPVELLNCPLVEPGYLVTIDQAEIVEIQEEKKCLTCIDKIMLCAFAISVFLIIGFEEFVNLGFGLFFVIIIYLATLFHWTI